MYLSAWGLSVWLKHVAWIDGTNKIVVLDDSTYVNFNSVVYLLQKAKY